MITIVDYKMGNLHSIKNILKKVGSDAIISSDPTIIRNASKIILPGVGSFDTAMLMIKELHLKEVLDEVVLIQKKPTLGICLGMQLMCTYSEEGNVEGLNWINANVCRFPKSIENIRLRIPHIGWTTVDIRKSIEFFIPDQENRFYFVHSYYVQCKNQDDVLTISHYGIPFCSAFQKDNIMGVQFHPEKSHKYGMHFFKMFALK
jgi:glutamine amidotransferase